jgi:hypothetical protein
MGRLRRADGRLFAIGLPPRPIEKIRREYLRRGLVARWCPLGCGARRGECPASRVSRGRVSGQRIWLSWKDRDELAGHSALGVPSATARARSNAAFEKKLKLIAKAARQRVSPVTA